MERGGSRGRRLRLDQPSQAVCGYARSAEVVALAAGLGPAAVGRVGRVLPSHKR